MLVSSDDEKLSEKEILRILRTYPNVTSVGQLTQRGFNFFAIVDDPFTITCLVEGLPRLRKENFSLSVALVYMQQYWTLGSVLAERMKDTGARIHILPKKELKLYLMIYARYCSADVLTELSTLWYLRYYYLFDTFSKGTYPHIGYLRGEILSKILLAS